ncbi:hypothetical protein ACN47E_003952 [Coniothyrium glycines]
MPVPALFELAKQRLVKNIDMLNDVGDLPYSFLEPVLRFIQNPDQLQELEENCTQLLGETGDIWLRFIKRDIPNWDQRPYEPRDPRKWSKVYRKLKKDTEKEKLADAEALKQQMKALQNDRAQNKTLIVDSKVGYGNNSSKFFTRGSGGGSSWGPPSGAPTKTGKVAFDKLRRGVFDHKRERPKASQMPAHILAQRKMQLKQAPARMVRMAETDAAAPKTMVLSKQASASMAPRASGSSSSKPHITQRPVVPQKALSTRTSLPTDQTFHAPRLKSTTQEVAAASAPKRKREAYSMFQPKKRKG